MECIFCKIRDRIIPKDFIYEDDNVMVFPDINPIKPVHLLIMPKKHIKDFTELAEIEILEELKKTIQRMILSYKIGNKGYRLVVNGGGAQVIDHLHIHLLGPVGKGAKM